ncbi:MAG: FMN-binding protein [Lentisphaeria bacterium]|nr:FMN-binding protein [Lentisphaeria bacterium]MBR7127795.1 FMN-binding protein [Lentisphaeria bacterium]
MSLKKSENIVVLGIFLGVIALIAAVLLGFFDKLTAKPIADAQLKATNESLKAVLPAFESTKVVDFTPIKYYGAFDKADNLIAIAAEGATPGYAGAIVAIVGLKLDGSINAVIITKQTETPGLGTNVCERKFTKTLASVLKGEKPTAALAPNRVLDYYSGKKCENGKAFTVSKDGGTAPYITGATVSSRAVAKLVSDINLHFIENEKAIIEKLTKGE